MELTNRSILHVKKNDIEYLQFRILVNYGITNCYTTRINGLDLNGNLESSKIEENYERLCNCLGIDRHSIVKPNQIHSDIIKRVDTIEEVNENADGLITNKIGINLCLSYADCTPILIYDPMNNAIANIHSGWKGTVRKIAQKAVIKMEEEYNSNPRDLIVCIGPCIKEDHFEVEDDVKDIFLKEFSYLGRTAEIIKNGKPGKYHIDTTLVNKLILEEVGVLEDKIYDSGICTACNSSVLHSYRADKDNSGRSVAIIGLK